MYFSPPRKSATCFSKSGNPLTEFDTVKEAQSSADYENSKNSNCNLAPYKCQKCGKFHLKPSEFIVEKLSTFCSCTRSGGRGRKDAYPTRVAAEKMAKIRAKSGVSLTPYQCPEGNGWHLTSQNTEHCTK